MPKNEFRADVEWFAGKMQEKLNENAHKGGWENETCKWLFGRLLEEATELNTAIIEKDPTKIIREAADVANFAMMIADNSKDEFATEDD